MTSLTAVSLLLASRFKAPRVLFALLALTAISCAGPPSDPRSTAPHRPAAAPLVVYTVAGTWTDSFGYTWVLTQDGSGNISGNAGFLGSGCPCGKGNCTGEDKSPIWPVSGMLTGNSFTLDALNPATGNVCTSYIEYDVTIGSDGISAAGTYQYAAGQGSVSMKLTETCAMYLNNNLQTSTSDGGTTMNAVFQPTFNGVNDTLSGAAKVCGFVAWDWVQTVTHIPSPSPYYENNLPDPANPINLTGAYVPVHDPPPWGFVADPNWLSYPFYYDPSPQSAGQDWSLAGHTDDAGGVLTFFDSPSDSCIPNALGAASQAYRTNAAVAARCGNALTAVGESISLSTYLAGINQDGSASVTDLGFTWSDSFNGTSGGVNTTGSTGPVDPGSGEGGITINGVSATSNYQPPPAGSSVASILPQFAFGGGWYSALYFTNLSGNGISFPVSFVSDASTPLTVPSIPGATTQVALSANGTAIIEAANQGSLLQGYAGFTLPDEVSGYGVFRLSVAGRSDQEAVVPLSSASATSNTLTWDDTNYITAVAVANPSSVATTVAVVLRDESGNVIGTSSIQLSPGAKTETTLRTLPGLSGMVGKRGSAQFTVSSGAVAVLGLRFNGSAFTSIPTTNGAAQNPAATVLPQVAFGGGWYSALYFTNLTGSAVSFPVNFTDDAGTPLTVPSVGGATAQVNLAAYGTAIIEAPNVGSLLQGYAAFTLPAGVYGYGVFRQSVAGRPDQEAVVPFSAASAVSDTLTWDETNFITAVAIVDPSSTAATVAVTLWDENGNTIGTSSIPLASNSKTETALRTLPGLSGMVGLRGSAQFTATGGNVAVLGLRFDGAAFTSIPTTNSATAASNAGAVLEHALSRTAGCRRF
jgi:hypothetical protein